MNKIQAHRNEFDVLIKVVENMMPNVFCETVGMSYPHFMKLHTILCKDLKRPYRLGGHIRLFLTLMFLSNEFTEEKIAQLYDMRLISTKAIIHDTLNVIYKKLGQIYSKQPRKVEWLEIADKYQSSHGLPNCIGSLTGRYLPIQKRFSMPGYYNRNLKCYAVAIVAVCDNNCIFRVVDVGIPGGMYGCEILKKSKFYKRKMDKQFSIPPDQCLLNSRLRLPYYFASAVKAPYNRNILCKFNEANNKTKIQFNENISKASSYANMAFDMLLSHWRIFSRNPPLDKDVMKKSILATIALHNFFIKEGKELEIAPHKFLPFRCDETEDELDEERDLLVKYLENY